MEKIDVVYKLGIGSKFEDLELRYSLRSLQNLPYIGNVFIIGNKPLWVKNIIHIPHIDCYTNNKDGNLLSKLLLACYDERLSKRFIHFSDDQVILKKTPIEIFERPTIENRHINFTGLQRLNRWQSRLKRTINVLKERGYKWNCYEGHIPYMLSKDLFSKTILQYDYGYDIGYCGNTLYFNSINAAGIENSQSVLIRIQKPYESVNELEKEVQNQYFLNYTESASNQHLFLFLRKLFPEKSKYEE